MHWRFADDKLLTSVLTTGQFNLAMVPGSTAWLVDKSLLAWFFFCVFTHLHFYFYHQNLTSSNSEFLSLLKFLASKSYKLFSDFLWISLKLISNIMYILSYFFCVWLLESSAWTHIDGSSIQSVPWIHVSPFSSLSFDTKHPFLALFFYKLFSEHMIFSSYHT